MSFDLDWLAFGPLSGHGVLMLVFTLAVFAAFVTDRLQIGTVCLAVLILLPALFFVFPMQGVEPYRFFGGFGHPALVAICSLMILGRSLVLTGALDPAARQLAWLVARAPWLALLVVLVGAAAMSGFVNDTPLVVLLIPLLATALRRAGRAPAWALSNSTPAACLSTAPARRAPPSCCCCRPAARPSCPPRRRRPPAIRPRTAWCW